MEKAVQRKKKNKEGDAGLFSYVMQQDTFIHLGKNKQTIITMSITFPVF